LTTYSRELRQRAVAAYVAGRGSQHELAGTFGINDKTLRDWAHRYATTGSVAPAPHRGGAHAKLTAAAWELLHTTITARPAAYLRELQALLAAELDVHVALITVSRALRRLGQPRKRPRSTRASATARRSRRSERLISKRSSRRSPPTA
jgi:transposase